MMKNFFMAGAMLLALSGQSWAVLVLNYSYSGATGNQGSTTAATVFANATASVISRGPGLISVATANSISSSGWATSATIVNTNDFYQFTFAANPGFQSTLNSLSFFHRVSSGTATATVRTSTNNFASFTEQGTASLSTVSNTLRTVALTGLTDVVQTISFRIYGTSFATSVTTWRLENGTGANSFLGTQLDGTVTAVPEPSSIALFSLAGCVGLVTVYRRRKSNDAVAV